MPSRRLREPRLKDFFRTRSDAMRNVLQTIEKVLDHDVSILILGESGSGKDYLAEAIHTCSSRRDGPFVHIDCPTIPADLFESELFGYEKGTFTDAQSRKIGKLEASRGGTVYFDDVTALTIPLQAKLLRAIQEKSFNRLGGHEIVPFDARILSSSSTDAESMRRDLYYRINVVTVRMPSLRERPEDVPLLAKQFAGRIGIAADAMRILTSYPWPGNVRQLRNAIERALVVGDGQSISAAAIPLAPEELVTAAYRGQWTLEELEASYIRQILQETRSNYSKAAEILGINRKTLLEKRRKYGLDR
jgi:DNA-binding NtrC family response regulator